MNRKELLKRHFTQKTEGEDEHMEKLFESESDLAYFLMERFQDVKDDSKGKKFTTDMLRSLSGKEKNEFEWLVNEVIGRVSWSIIYYETTKAKRSKGAENHEAVK